MVYARRVDSRLLTLIVSGRLWRNSLVMQDEETGTYWSHVTGEAIEGPLKGKRLETIPAVQTTWKAWRAEHPNTEVLKKSAEITSSRYESYFSDPKRTGLFRSRWLVDRMPGKTKVHGVALGPHALAVTDESLAAGGKVVRKLGDAEIQVVRSRDGGVRAFRMTGRETAEELPVTVAYWFAWSNFYPNTQVVD